jgi:methionyl-tRNA formyltransferase
MDDRNYIVATIKQWNINAFENTIKNYPGNWELITHPEKLTLGRIKEIEPEYIFFPHWNHIVSKDILNFTTCICFHETDLPFGRGGSPLQNLIEQGHRETVISALKMTGEIDAGPIYLKKNLSLEGLAEDIFIRASNIVAEMVKTIIMESPEPKPQTGQVTLFNRRKPEQSKIPLHINHLGKLFDHIRMLDAEGYPKAFLEMDGFRYEFTRPALKSNEIFADVRITEFIGNPDD